MRKLILFTGFIFFAVISIAQKDSTIKKKDRKRDVLLQTTMGDMIIRLSDETPLHRDNFLKLVKIGFYDSVLFHRVIKDFMIQGGDPDSKQSAAGAPLGNGGPGYTIPAEFSSSLFHKKGVIAAARMGDQVNPEKASNGSQFYIVQGKKFTDEELNSMEAGRLNGKKMPASHREAYKTMGGSPHLDENYTVFGEVVNGIEVIDKIASVQTAARNRPVENVSVVKASLIKRKKTKR